MEDFHTPCDVTELFKVLSKHAQSHEHIKIGYDNYKKMDTDERKRCRHDLFVIFFTFDHTLCLCKHFFFTLDLYTVIVLKMAS